MKPVPQERPGGLKVTRRTFVAQMGAGGAALAAASAVGCKTPGHERFAVLENQALRLTFSEHTGLLTQIENKLTGEALKVQGDGFELAAEEFSLTPATLPLKSVQKKSDELLEATYNNERHTIVAVYKLGAQNHFFEKHLVITSASPYRLKNLAVSKLRLTDPTLKFVKYPYQKNAVYFARSEKGGIFLGLELPFDDSSLAGDGTVSLGYQPSLKVKSNELLESEPAFVGVYKRQPGDAEQPNLPLSAESEAMVAMTSTIMGPPRHGLVPLACGWWCEMRHESYQTEAQVEADMRSIDFLAECGIDGFTDNHPWSGETGKMNALRQEDHYEPGSLVKKLLAYAKRKKVGVVFWPTMTNTNPWWREMGKPFRSDRPDWVIFPEGRTLSSTIPTGRTFTEFTKGNCIANEPFWQWLMGLQLDGMRTGYFDSWVMDGDFFGGGGIVIPVNCPSGQHDHLPGDSNYACERALNRMMAMIRDKYPNIFIGPMCRPAQDLGIWSNRNADGVFTLDEFGLPEPLPGLSNLPVNVMCGDKIRKWSRVRVQYNFFPHYLDQPQVFAAPKSMKGPAWPSEKIDYVMLSALSSSPNLLFYLPTKAGIPARDKAEIRKWLDWGRKNTRYLQVRKDLPQWPEAGKVDGSAHIIGNRGLVFLFNPNHQAIAGRFRLDRESIGLMDGTHFDIAQTYPTAGARQQLNLGQEVVWEVPPETSLVLEISAVNS